jgi:hypothetical protein
MLLKAPKPVDEQLKDLIIEVCQCQDSQHEQQKALDRLLNIIQRLPRLLKSSHPNYPEALNLTWTWVSRNIQAFDIQSPFLQERLVNWINSYLRWRIKDLYIGDRPSLISLDRPISNSEGECTTLLELLPDPQFPPPLNLLDVYLITIQAEEQQRIGVSIEQYIECDPDGKLRQCHPRQRHDCHCQILAQRLLLKEPPDKLTKVAEDLQINYQTLNSHWKQKCLPLLQLICRNFGYQSWIS